MNENSSIYRLCLSLTYFSLLVLTIGIFLFPKILFLNQFLLYFPCFYLTYKAFQKNGLSEFRKWKLSQLSLLGFAITAIISILVNWSIMDEPIKNLFRVKHFFIPVLGYYAYKEALKNFIDFKKKKLLLNLFFAGVSISTLYGLTAQILGYSPLSFNSNYFYKGRNSGMIDLLHYAYGISLVMILLTGLLIYRDKIKNYISTKWLIFHWIINFFGLYFTRGSWIGFIFPLPLFFLKKSKSTFFASIIIPIISLVVLINFDKNAEDRFFHEGKESNRERITLFKTAIYAFLEKPILGWGYRNFEFHVKSLKKKYDLDNKWQKGSAHNNFLEHLASTGVVGFLFLFLFHLFWAIEAYSFKSYLGNISFVFFASFFVTGMVYYTLILGPDIVLIMAVYSLFISALPERAPRFGGVRLTSLIGEPHKVI